MEFVNRTDELTSLESEYRRKGGSFVVMYGRRRTGKTTLIRKFIKDKPALYFLADKQLEQQQQQHFKEQLAAFTGDKFLQSLAVNHWDQLFNYLEQLTEKRRGKKLIVVMDEFQYLAGSNPAFPSMLQRYWDNQLQTKNIMLVICGSLISMMFRHALSYNAPLFGRRTSQIHLHPFRYEHVYPFLKEKNESEKLEFYGLCGGIPRYLLEMHPSKTLLQNVREQVLDRNKMLFSEPRFILNDELTETSTYFSILQTIAAGNHKIGNISASLGLPNNSITSHLDRLRELDLVERTAPVTERYPEKSRKGLYVIKDFFFRFWFRYVFPFQSEIEMGNVKLVLSKIKQEMGPYASIVFEEVCRQMIVHFAPFPVQKWGRHWDKDTEIDVVALNETEKKVLFGECKWSNQPVNLRILHELKKKAAGVEWHSGKRREYYILFSKNGFSPDILSFSGKDQSIILVDWRRLPSFRQKH